MPVQPENRQESQAGGAKFSSSYKENGLNDKEYGSFVSKEMKRLVESAAVGESSDEEYPYSVYLTQVEQQLSKLSNPKVAEKVSPLEMSTAFSELLGNMSIYDQGRKSSDPVSAEAAEEQYKISKKLLHESVRRAFPEYTMPEDATQTKQILESVDRAVKAEFFTGHFDVAPGAQLKEWMQNKPDQMLGYLESVLQVGEHMKNKAFANFSSDDGKAVQESMVRLAKLSEGLYRLSLLKDEMERRVYGQSGHTAVEKGKIDDLKRKAEQVAEAKRPETLIPKEQAVIDQLGQILQQEEKDRAASQAKKSVLMRRYTPAIEGFQSVYKDQKELAARILFLLKRRREEGDKIFDALPAGPLKEKEFARSKAVGTVVQELTPAENQALTAASQREVARVLEESQKLGGIEMNAKPLPLDVLLINLFEKVKE